MNVMTFNPVYGWGWFRQSSTVAVDVPERFHVAVQSASAREVEGIIDPPHEYAGMKVRLGVRNVSAGTKNWNVHLTVPGHGDITGFAQSDVQPGPAVDPHKRRAVR